MMDTQVDRELLEKIADLIGKPVGAFNIRKDCGCDGRESTDHIKIDDRTDGHAGIDIRILDGTKGETCHIPVIITKSGVEETVYNDFYIGEDCDVEIVAGCGIHNCGDQTSRHDGIHTFHVGKNSHVHYSEKHYAEGDGRGEKIFNPRTVVYLDEGASIQMDTVQIKGVDSTKRYTKIVCGKGAEAVITERLLTHGTQTADSDMVIELNGEGSTLTWDAVEGAVAYAVFYDGQFVGMVSGDAKSYDVEADKPSLDAYTVRAANAHGGFGAAASTTATGISSVESVDGGVVGTAYYSLQGTRVSDAYAGVVIKVDTMADGSVKAAKVIR